MFIYGASWVMSEIGREIIVLRAQKGWTQQKLAESLNTSQRTVAAWESGSSIPRKAMAVRIAQVFELPNDYFLKFISNETEINSNYSELENLFNETTSGMSEKEKSIIMEKFQNIINGNQN